MNKRSSSNIHRTFVQSCLVFNSLPDLTMKTWELFLKIQNLYVTPLGLCYTHPPKPHSHPDHGTNVTHLGPHRPTSFLFRVGLKPGSQAWEAGALTRRLKTTATSQSVTSAPLEIRGVRFTCTAPTRWASLALTPLNLTPIRVTAPM